MHFHTHGWPLVRLTGHLPSSRVVGSRMGSAWRLCAKTKGPKNSGGAQMWPPKEVLP